MFFFFQDKMISLKDTVADPSDESSVNDAQIFSQVLGSRSGYLRGLGRCVKPSSTSSSSSKARSNDDKTKKLEEAALEIERLRSKEKELLTRLDQAADLEARLEERLQLNNQKMFEQFQLMMSQNPIPPLPP